MIIKNPLKSNFIFVFKLVSFYENCHEKQNQPKKKTEEKEQKKKQQITII